MPWNEAEGYEAWSESPGPSRGATNASGCMVENAGASERWGWLYGSRVGAMAWLYGSIVGAMLELAYGSKVGAGGTKRPVDAYGSTVDCCDAYGLTVGAGGAKRPVEAYGSTWLERFEAYGSTVWRIGAGADFPDHLRLHLLQADAVGEVRELSVVLHLLEGEVGVGRRSLALPGRDIPHLRVARHLHVRLLQYSRHPVHLLALPGRHIRRHPCGCARGALHRHRVRARVARRPGIHGLGIRRHGRRLEDQAGGKVGLLLQLLDAAELGVREARHDVVDEERLRVVDGRELRHADDRRADDLDPEVVLLRLVHGLRLVHLRLVHGLRAHRLVQRVRVVQEPSTRRNLSAAHGGLVLGGGAEVRGGVGVDGR
eukprot:3938892-Rhodomonas_salina.2